jgi:hypothetical protein
MTLVFNRVQSIEVQLKRIPSTEEITILLGEDDELTMFDLPDDLIDWESEEIIGEDYSSDIKTYIYPPTIINNLK